MNTNHQNGHTATIEALEDLQISVERKPGKLKLKVYDSEDSFEAFSSLWSDLAKRTRGHIYMSNEWAECWWRYFGKNKQRSLFIITVWKLDEVIALAPMYIGYSKLGPLVIERRLQIVGSGGSPNEQLGYLDDYGISDFLDFLVDDDYKQEVADLLVEFFQCNTHKIDRTTFHQVGDNSFIMKYLYPRIMEAGIHCELQHIDTCPQINLEGQDSFPKYLKKVKSNARRRFRQTRKAIGTDEGFEIEAFNTSKEIAEGIETLIKLHQDRWNQLGYLGVFYDMRFTAFFKEIVRSAYARDWLWFKQAKDESGACAMRVVLKYNGRYYDYISGFDNDCPSSKYRPGIGLLLGLVEEAIHENIDRIELLRGEEGYKYDFTSDNFKNWKLSFSPDTGSSRIAFLASFPLKVSALIYKHTMREFKLLHVQYKQHGFPKMFSSYINFWAYKIRQRIKS